MYQIYFNGILSQTFHSLKKWHQAVCLLQSQGFNYYSFEKTNFGYKFFF